MTEALIIVDMQRRWIGAETPLFPEADDAVRAINLLRDRCAAHSYPVFHVTMAELAGSPMEREEAEIIPELAPRSHEFHVTKRRYSAFFGTDLRDRLAECGVTRVTVVGYQMRACVFASALDAYQHDLKTEVVSEATLETDAAYREMYLRILQDAEILVPLHTVLARGTRQMEAMPPP